MKKVLLALLFLSFFAQPIHAIEGTSSPHLVVNFASINDLDWGAPEAKWQTEVKPTIVNEIQEMKTILRPPVATQAAQDDRSNNQQLTNNAVLSWSTLMEYMNFPMDTPSEHSIYAIKMRRILEVAQDLDFPVFVPLNGFQWWDQLPELYNWWDPDGSQTDPNFFARQKNPSEFKARFIAGYDPKNKLNVEWQSLDTPMKLGIRNWGGGGFRLAPPPNLLSPAYQRVQRDRLKVILREIKSKRAEWKSDGKDYLFAGLSIGTEISLNASVTPADEFRPYGYRSAQDLGCSSAMVACRTQVLKEYLEMTSQFINRSGIPRSLLYTHVYGETDPSDPHYSPYAEAAFNLYSIPGSSFYGHKDDPLASGQWKKMLHDNGEPSWGAIEYSDTPTTQGLMTTLSSASLVDIYNWDSVKGNSSSILAIKTALQTPRENDLMEKCENEEILHVQSGVTARIGNPEIPVATVSALPHGTYTWFSETDCENGRRVYSDPQILYVPVSIEPDTTPAWVRFLERMMNR